MAPAAKPERLCLAVIGVLCALMLAANLVMTHGHVLFTQDDPFIHLALAERLAQSGHYGLNTGEVAAPSSSVLYPFLLAPLLWLGLGPAAALLVCLAATAASVMLLCALCRESGYRLDKLPALALAGLCAAWALAFNLPGLALSGMEHALHVALCLACLLGLLRLTRDGHLWWLFPPAASLLPLIRYEGVLLWLICCAVLIWRRYWMAALLTFLPTLAALVAFSLFLVHHNLQPLPSSVLAKAGSGMMGARGAFGNAIAIVLHNVAANSTERGFASLCILAGLNLAALARLALRRQQGQAILPAAGAAVCCAHLLAGKLGEFGRYEVYAEVCGAVTAVIAWSPFLSPRLARRWLLAALLPMIVMPQGVSEQILVPFAAANIYAQQYQLGRFAKDFWHGPVGINDLGEVSYGNPSYVLDYAGLGSEAARQARARATDPGWMDDLAARHHVGLVMIFRTWFPRLPSSWREVARLHLLTHNVVAGSPTVSFYATTPQAAAKLLPLLPAFAASLPASARLEVLLPRSTE